MPKFDFKLDQLVSVWQRSNYSIEADSYEEALSIMEKEFEDPQFEEPEYIDTEYIYETVYELSPEENDNQSTKELLFGKKPIKTNVDKKD